MSFSFSPGHVRTAIVTMRINRWRSLLTMFGVIVGVASVILIIGISQGVKNDITNQVNAYSKNVITVSSKASSVSNFGFNSVPTVSTLTNSDVNALANDKHVIASVPLAFLSGSVSGEKTFSQGVVIATTDKLPLVLNQTVEFGNFFSSGSGNNDAAVLGAGAAQHIFGQSIPLGYTVNWRGQSLIVNGVLNSFKATPFSNNTLYNNATFIPEAAASQANQGTNSIFEILVRADSTKNLNTVAKEINQTLIRTHAGQQNYSVLLPSQVAASNTNILSLMADLTIGIAVIALFVGGVGIMNVMLVSVTERMHEIGIRKAIGASNRQIMSQFLVEATAVSIAGGLIGIIVALIINFGIRISTSLTPSINWQVIVLTALISIAIGVVFGSVPAFRASRKQPIEALRND